MSITMQDYLRDSARTETGDFHPDNVHASAVGEALLARNSEDIYSDYIDTAKKGLFYGKVVDLPDPHRVGLDYNYDNFKGHSKSLHALLGIDSEAAEIADLTHDILIGDRTLEGSREKLMDECGDMLWFMAALFREMGTTFEEVAERNLNKLKVRYPAKFEQSLALNRNDAEEAKVFSS